MSLFNDASLITTPNGFKAGKLFSVKPFDGSGDFTWVRNTSATRVNESGLIETVGANVPRLDYSNGGCPCILVEPQRTNLLRRSEEFNVSPWTGGLTTATITPNTSVAPDGSFTADTIENVVGNQVGQIATITSGMQYTFSIYLKRISGTGSIRLVDVNGVATVVNITSDWARYSITVTSSSATGRAYFRVDNAGDSIYAWGAQLEQGSYATSYIPTVASAVTRNADVCSKTGITDLIGQSEGTMFVGVYDYNFPPNNSSPYLEIYADANNRIIIFKNTSNQYQIVIRTSGVTTLNILTPSISGNSKIAIGYKENDCVVYVNGVQVGTDTSVTIPTCSAVYLGGSITGVSVQKDVFNAAALFKTRLSNFQLAQLTTI